MKTPQKLLAFVEEKDGDIFVARCPQLGLVAAGKTQNAAKNALAQLVNAQYSYAKKTGRIGEIFRPANEFHFKKQLDDGFELVPGSYAPA